MTTPTPDSNLVLVKVQEHWLKPSAIVAVTPNPVLEGHLEAGTCVVRLSGAHALLMNGTPDEVMAEIARAWARVPR